MFSDLFEKFHVGIWSKMLLEQLRPLLAHLLPVQVLDNLAFVYGREYCLDSQKFPWCYKTIETLFRKGPSKDMCVPDQVLMVDVCPISLRRTPDTACYIPHPFVGDVNFPNDSRVIPNISTDIIPFIYPLYEYESILEYLRVANTLGQ